MEGIRPALRGTLLLLCMSLLGGCTETANDYDTYVENGRTYSKQGQFRAAMIEARNALKRDPQRQEAHLLLAEIYYTLGQGRLASQELDQVTVESPEHLSLLIRNNLLLGKFGTALVLLNKHKARMEKDNETAYWLLVAEAKVGLEQYAEAREQYDRVLAREPKNTTALLGVALLQAFNGDALGAEHYLDQVLSIDKSSVDAYQMKARLAIARGDLDQAEVELTEAVSHLPFTDIYTPERSRILSVLSTILTRQGRTGEALVYARMLAEAFPYAMEMEEKYQSALMHVKEGELEQAEKVLKEILEQVPGAERPGTLLGVINFLKGNNDFAEQYFLENLDLETAGPTAKTLYAVNALRLNRAEKVIEALAEDVKTTKDSNVLAVYGLALLSLNRREEAREVLTRALTLDKGNARVGLLLAMTFESETVEDKEKALAELQKVYDSNSTDPFLQAALLTNYMDLGRMEDARKLAESILQAHPELASSYLISAIFYNQQEQYGKALEFLRQAEKQAPNDITVQYQLAETMIRMADFDGAEASFMRIIGISKAEVHAHKGLVTVYEARGQREAGLERLRELSKSLGSELPLLVLSDYYARSNQLDESMRYLEEARKMAPSSSYSRRTTANVYYARARSFMQARKFEEARSAIFTALGYFPGNRVLLTLLAETEMRAGQFKEASKVIDEVRLAHPSIALADVLLADLAASTKDFKKAMELYQKAWDAEHEDLVAAKMVAILMGPPAEKDRIEGLFTDWEKRHPKSLVRQITRAGYLMDQGRDGEAVALYERIIELEPRSPASLNNLAWLYSKQGKNAEAITLVKRALSIQPEDPLIKDTYAWLLFRQGDVSEARKWATDAVRGAPDNELLKDHLAEIIAAEAPGEG